MKAIHFILTVICLSFHSLAAQPTTVNANEKIVAHLKRYRSDYVKSMLDKRPATIQSYWAENIRTMPEFQKTLIGKDNVAKYYAAFTNRFEIRDATRNEMEILDMGRQVLEIGTLFFTLTVKATNQKVELAGTYFNLWEKSNDDELLLITEAWNYSQYYGDIQQLLKFEEAPGIHVALLPNVPINTNISFELAAFDRLLDATVTLHDDNTWSHYYASDAILIPNHHPPYVGKKAIDEFITLHVKELPIFESLDIRNDRIDNVGDYIIQYSSHIASWRNGEFSGVSFGKNIRIWRREPNHSLKVFRSIAMYD